MGFEERYSGLKGFNLTGLSSNQVRKFSFLVKNLAVDAVKSEVYSRVLNGLESDEIFAGKYFGLPMWDNLILDSGKEEEKKNLEIDMVLMNVSMTKNIIKTAIQGMNGTVKEYISDGDFAINLKGALFSEKNSNAYPEDDVRTLIEICRKQESIRVESGFLSRFDIVDIVIENYKLEAAKATRNVQFFDINAVSDTPKELIFNL